jgi:UDP-glucuronate 4-epimerase
MGDADVVIHLAAWPGVRTSALYPHAYAENNISVFNKIIESVRILRTSRFLYASSSSVYGNLGVSQPVKEIQADGKELLSFYSATKWINERVAAQYKLNQDVDSTALRFFTVYGPYGRPDMAYWDFTRKLLANETINLHGEKGGKRCFTYIDDALEILLRLINLDCKLHQVPAINISNGQPHTAFELMDNLAIALDVRDPKFLEVQRPKDDVIGTWADTTKLEELVGATPRTSLSQGTENFVKWYMRNGKPS